MSGVSWGALRAWVRRVCGISSTQAHEKVAPVEPQRAPSPNEVLPPIAYWKRIDLENGLSYYDRPAYLKELTPNEFEQILPIAVRLFHGHVPRVAEYHHIELSSGLSTEVAIRMLSFHMYSIQNLQEWDATEMVEQFEILRVPDACKFCRSYPSGPYRLDEGPEVPLRGCTHKLGCRCTLLPKT